MRPGDDAIVLADVAFAYAGKPPVFEGLCLRVRRGERIGLFGASGAGKSTLVQLLFGLRQPTAGAVLVDGRAARDGYLAPHRDVLGYAGAEPFLLHATVEENLRYGNPAAGREDVLRAAALAEADAFITALPDGYATVIGGRGLALSDGQRQRLGLARLFLRDPRILVLDEAFCALDLETEARVREKLWHAFPDRTAVVISHRPVGLAQFDRLLFLHDGRFTDVTAAALRELLASDRDWTERPVAAPR
jgi:ABC-type multidrug transport system fused ATPase/permease subunit